MTKNIAISVKNIKKNFILPHEKTTSIKSGVLGAFKKQRRTNDVQNALKGVSFDIKEGEFFGILGRNGSGKSTLLKMLAGIYQPTDGSIDIEGKLVPFIELGVGFNPELTGRENVYLNGALLGFSKKEIDDRYEDIVEFAELEEFMDQKLKNYSSGMQVRLAFSVATRAEADILLVDEVLAVGDADFQRKCYDFFKSLKKTGKTVVFVTHDMGAVKEYCDKAVLIDSGKIISSGAAASVADEYLKLFNKPTETEDDEISDGRWGNGRVKIYDPVARILDDSISITLSLKAQSEDVEDVVVGIKLIDSAGNIVAGANTANAHIGARKSLHVSKDSKHQLVFTFENLLGTGTYGVTITARSSDKVTFYDNWDNAARISISRDESYYPIVLPVKISSD